jgi:hypothetical protein
MPALPPQSDKDGDINHQHWGQRPEENKFSGSERYGNKRTWDYSSEFSFDKIEVALF